MREGKAKGVEGCSISIPKWYDYELLESHQKQAEARFQFQNGTIMSLGLEVTSKGQFISIPKWYDYESKAVDAEKQKLQYFNSKMVRL